MVKDTDRRIRELERRRQATSSPSWVSVQSMDELPTVLATLQRPCKVYVGCSPDDWDIEEHESA